MPTVVPAICKKCDLAFIAPVNIADGEMTFVDCQAGPCPSCGGPGIIPDGTYGPLGGILFHANQMRMLTYALTNVHRMVSEGKSAKQIKGKSTGTSHT